MTGKSWGSVSSSRGRREKEGSRKRLGSWHPGRRESRPGTGGENADISEGAGNQIEPTCSEDWTRILHVVNQTIFMFLVFSVNFPHFFPTAGETQEISSWLWLCRGATKEWFCLCACARMVKGAGIPGQEGAPGHPLNQKGEGPGATGQ